jgi:drug/metabolite transporter (DMT)-like permease
MRYSHPHSLRAHLLLVSIVFVWGSTFVLVKNALADISPLLFNLIRMTLGFLCLAIVYHRHFRRMRLPVIAAGAIVGLCLAAGYQFQTAGLRLTTPSKSAFITGMVVVIVPMLAVIPGLRPPSAALPRWNAWLGAITAFIGIVLLTAPAGHAVSFAAFRQMNLGDLLTCFCALGFAFQVIALAHFSPRFPFEQLAILQIGFGALFMAVSLPFFEHPYVHWTPTVLAALGITAILATALAFTVLSWAQSILPATHTALILALEPVFAWLTSFLILGQGLHGRALAGALLVLAGIALTEIVAPPVQPSHSQSTSMQMRDL